MKLSFKNMKISLPLLMPVLVTLISFTVFPIDKAHATPSYYCFYDASGTAAGSASDSNPNSGTYIYATSANTSGASCSSLSLTGSNPPVGTIDAATLGGTLTYWNGTEYVANDGACSVSANGQSYSSTWNSGECKFSTGSNTGPSAPTPPSGGSNLASYYKSVSKPGDGYAMCSSGALSTGGAVFGFVFTGAICEANAIAGSSQIYAYDATGSKSQDGVNANQFWARNSITSVGLMTSLGGAQLYSLDAGTGDVNSAVIVDNNLAAIGSINNTTNRSASLVLDSQDSNAARNKNAAASLYGNVGDPIGPAATSSANVAVSISGSGSGARTYSGGKANWADVLISSASYEANAPKTDGLIDFSQDYTANTGSAIVVTDYGVQIITPAPANGSTITNTFGANNNTAEKTGITYNNLGGGTGITVNNFGNANGSSELNLQAANSATTIQNGINTNSLGGAGSNGLYGTGGSILSPSDTSSLNGAVLKDTKNTQVATVDSNGKISIVTAGATPTTAVQQTTAMMTVTNGIGNTHGFIVNEQQAVMSGGVNSTSMTLNDYGATFSNSATGAPVQVHGVNDGTAQFDAVNVRQLYGAVAASMATAPNFTVEPGETGIGIGTAMMGQYPAVGMAFAKKNKNGSQINVGVAAAEHVPIAIRAGVGWVW